ncbi:MAG: hypothetical protein ACWA40_05515 [Planktomarina sp.]
MLKPHIIPVIAATLWISISEFLRNEFWLKYIWVEHYAGMGLNFPDAAINGAVWGLWSLLFAIAIHSVLTRFNLVQGALVSWFMGFVLMWVVTWNLGVFPVTILPYAVPLSLLETFVAAWIITKLSQRTA